MEDNYYLLFIRILLMYNTTLLNILNTIELLSSNEFQQLIRSKHEIEAIGVANALAISEQTSHKIRNIRSGFQKSGVWNYDDWGPYLSTLQDSIQLDAKSSSKITSLSDLLPAFEKNHARSLQRQL